MFDINLHLTFIIFQNWKPTDESGELGQQGDASLSDGDDDDDADDGGDGGDPLIAMMMIKAVLLAFSLSSNNGRWLW